MLYSTEKSPFLPFLVVIKITPFDARDPYRADADCPLRTVIVSMSSGFRLPIPSPLSEPPHSPALPRCELSIGTPLITNSGDEPEVLLLLLALVPVFILGMPRNKIRAVPPGPPLVPFTLSPATLPSSEKATFVSRAR